MKLVNTHQLKVGNKLALPLRNENGTILLQEGVSLTERMINKLKFLNIHSVHVEEKTYANYAIKNMVELEKETVLQYIEDYFFEIKETSEIYKKISLYKAAPKFKQIIKILCNKIKSEKNIQNLLVNTYKFDKYIFVHSLNVTLYSLALGIEIGLNNEQLELLGLSALFHDIGKVTISKEILLKPQTLNQEEYEAVKMHTTNGFELLNGISNIPYIVALCAKQHHERLDGTGYPLGITNEKIHIYSKIIAVADVYDAKTSERVYRRAILPSEALEELYVGANSLYDEELIKAFRKVIVFYPNGTRILTNDNREGEIVLQNKGVSHRPIIRIDKENGKFISKSYLIDLIDENHVLIMKEIN